MPWLDRLPYIGPGGEEDVEAHADGAEYQEVGVEDDPCAAVLLHGGDVLEVQLVILGVNGSLLLRLQPAEPIEHPPDGRRRLLTRSGGYRRWVVQWFLFHFHFQRNSFRIIFREIVVVLF